MFISRFRATRGASFLPSTLFVVSFILEDLALSPLTWPSSHLSHLPLLPPTPLSRLETLALLPISLRLISVLCLKASALGLPPNPSKLGLTLEELLCLLLRFLVSSGSPGESPDARANRLSTSVRETTPDKRPLIPAPGRLPADTAMLGDAGIRFGGVGSYMEP
jgi:hypothetical protein